MDTSVLGARQNVLITATNDAVDTKLGVDMTCIPAHSRNVNEARKSQAEPPRPDTIRTRPEMWHEL